MFSSILLMLSTPTLAAVTPCLCIFDVDRTLTGQQGSVDSAVCPADKLNAGIRKLPPSQSSPHQTKRHASPHRPHTQFTRSPTYAGTPDSAYDGGTFTSSDLLINLDTTFCGRMCYIGIITAGDASSAYKQAWGVRQEGPTEMELLHKKISSLKYGIGGQGLAGSWVTAESAILGGQRAPFVLKTMDGQKHNLVPLIIEWYERTHSILFTDKASVFFFDDRADNVLGFVGSGYNAKQISCATRADAALWTGCNCGSPARCGSEQEKYCQMAVRSVAGLLGLCGGTSAEVAAPELGVRLCGEHTCREEAGPGWADPDEWVQARGMRACPRCRSAACVRVSREAGTVSYPPPGRNQLLPQLGRSRAASRLELLQGELRARVHPRVRGAGGLRRGDHLEHRVGERADFRLPQALGALGLRLPHRRRA